MSLKGTETERNLLTAFAGESQARNRYTYFAGQGPGRRLRADGGHLRGDGEPGEGARQAAVQVSSKAAKSRFGPLSRPASSAAPCRTCKRPPPASTTRPPRCTPGSRKWRKKKGLRKSPPCSARSPSPRSGMRTGTSHWPRTSRMAGLQAQLRPSGGSAATAGWSTKGLRLPRSARPAASRGPISRSKQRTISRRIEGGYHGRKNRLDHVQGQSADPGRKRGEGRPESPGCRVGGERSFRRQDCLLCARARSASSRPCRRWTRRSAIWRRGASTKRPADWARMSSS